MFDVAHMVDLVLKQNGEVKAGIQVKPDSFYHMKLPYVKKLHDQLDYPVYDLIYDSEGNWTNYLATISYFLWVTFIKLLGQRKFVRKQQYPMNVFGELLEDRGGPFSENSA